MALLSEQTVCHAHLSYLGERLGEGWLLCLLLGSPRLDAAATTDTQQGKEGEKGQSRLSQLCSRGDGMALFKVSRAKQCACPPSRRDLKCPWTLRDAERKGRSAAWGGREAAQRGRGLASAAPSMDSDPWGPLHGAPRVEGPGWELLATTSPSGLLYDESEQSPVMGTRTQALRARGGVRFKTVMVSGGICWTPVHTHRRGVPSCFARCDHHREGQPRSCGLDLLS